MNRDAALALADRVRFKPGWNISFEARAQTLHMNVIFRNYDTGTLARLGHLVEIPISADEAIPFGDVDEPTLARRILDALIKIDTHEDREFFRLQTGDGRAFAPFHPHRADGNDLWDRTAPEINRPTYSRLASLLEAARASR